MAGGVVWDATAVSRAITILNYSSENVASRTLTPPSNAGSNEADLATQVERINRVIQMASFCSLAALTATAASEAFAAPTIRKLPTFDDYARVSAQQGGRMSANNGTPAASFSIQFSISVENLFTFKDQCMQIAGALHTADSDAMRASSIVGQQEALLIEECQHDLQTTSKRM